MINSMYKRVERTSRTTIDSRDQPNYHWPHSGDEVGRKSVINDREAADILEDVETMALYDVF